MEYLKIFNICSKIVITLCIAFYVIVLMSRMLVAYSFRVL